MTVILFDKLCPLCRVLASLLADDLPKGWKLEAWQEFSFGDQPPPANEIIPGHPLELCIRPEGKEWLLGEEAWNYLVQHEPRLLAYQRLASQIGISPPLSARWLRRLAHGLRRLCGRCPSR